MPRQRRAAPARSAAPRPTATAPSVRPGPTQPPSRQASTSAHVPASSQANAPSAQVGKSPGLFGQMASTAAGVAVGSSIGHAIGGFFTGGSSPGTSENQALETSSPSQQNDVANQDNPWGGQSCDVAAKQFTTCMDENGGNMQICQWYLDQLKSCQAMAKNY